MTPVWITDVDIVRFFACPHWPYWERFGDPALKRSLDTSESELLEKLWHEQEVIKVLAPEIVHLSTDEYTAGAEETERLMQAGVPAIYRPMLRYGRWIGRPTLLLRIDDPSHLGPFSYIPVDIRRSHAMRKDEQMRLLFFAWLIEMKQGVYPSRLEMVNADREHLTVSPEQHQEAFRDLLFRLEGVCDGELPEPVYRKACEDTSPWGQACFKLAVEQDDIALLFNVTQRQLHSLRLLGVQTVHQAAEIEPLDYVDREPGLTFKALLHVQRQAKSLVERSVIVRSAVESPRCSLEIFFDIESHPGTDSDYVYGLFTRREGKEEFLRFTAEAPEQEERLWREFLVWLETLPSDACIYHYGDYEQTRLTVMAKRYHDEENPWLKRFCSQMIDIKELVSDHVTFPIFFYSLKAIGAFLGVRRSEDIHHGRESVFVYEDWLKTKNPFLWRQLLEYNEDDVRATASLLDWLRVYAKTDATYAEPYPWQGRSSK